MMILNLLIIFSVGIYLVFKISRSWIFFKRKLYFNNHKYIFVKFNNETKVIFTYDPL